MILYATASLAPNDIQTLRDVQAFASMGFLQGGVELQSVRDADVKTYASHGRAGSNVASAIQETSEVQPFRESGYPHILISYAYDDDATFFTDKLGYSPPNRLGDSGAFTAWTTGQQIDLQGLIDWCKRNQELHPGFSCISLDVIPGEAGGNSAPTSRQREAAMAESLANGDAMREQGLKIMEVYHVFESLDHLDLLIERRQPGEVIGFGGMVGRSTALKQQFCDAAFARIREHSGAWDNLVPVHGLGLSVRSNLAARYPWWSIDSSSWIAPAMYGKPVRRNGRIGDGDDRRTSNRSVRHLYLTRVLEGWLDRERQLTEMWERRGVRWQP